jgi:RNA polymerase sigma factor (sigma-70 family)
VAALYQAHSPGLVRLAYVMLGNRASAEDVVQEAFYGLYRRWDRLPDTDRALRYVRSAVLNGCRTVLRRRPARDIEAVHHPPEISAEAAALTGEERRPCRRPSWFSSGSGAAGTACRLERSEAPGR